MKSFKLALIMTTVAFANSTMMAKYAHNPFVDGDFVLPIRPINPVEDEKDNQTDNVVIEADTVSVEEEVVVEAQTVPSATSHESKKEEQKTPATKGQKLKHLMLIGGLGLAAYCFARYMKNA